MDIIDACLPFLQSFPAMDPMWAIILSIVGPIAFWCGLCAIYQRQYFPELTYSQALAKFVVTRAGIISFVNTLVVLILCLNQLSCFATKSSFGVEIMYYTKVDLPEYDALDALNSAETISSLNTVISSQRRLNGGSRSAFTLVYHTSNYEDLLSSTQLLTDICITERYIKSNVQCLNTNTFLSFIPEIFDPVTCVLVNNPTTVIQGLSSDELSGYFEDGINAQSPSSHILISVTQEGTCYSDESVSSMLAALNDNAAGSITVTFADGHMLQTEFEDSIINAATLAAAGLVLSFAFFMFWIRGVVCGIVTVCCIFFSVIAAGGTLSTWEYGSFSAFNVMSVFILVGVGANAVLLFDSTWRGIVAPGHPITPSELLAVFSHVAEPTLFTILAACLSLFSKLASPVIVISQLGAFMGTAVVVFYFQLHFVIVPLWIVANRFRLPLFWHNAIDKCRSAVVSVLTDSCGCLVELCFTDHEDSSRYSLMSHNDGVGGAGAAGELSSPVSNSEGDAVLSVQESAAVRKRSREIRHESWVRRFKKICNNYWILMALRLTVLAMSIFGLVVIAYLVTLHYVIDFGIPQLFNPSTNLGQCFVILRVYKSTLLDYSTSSIPTPPIPPGTPTEAPVFRPPTQQPTFGRPTQQPTSTAPTCRPSQGAATPRPTRAAPTTRAPTIEPVPPNNPVYIIKGCYGISYHKEYKDTIVTATWNGDQFTSYTSSDGFMTDQYNLCQYVQKNRAYLNIDTDWEMTRDCLYYQLLNMYKQVQSVPALYRSRWESSSETPTKLTADPSTSSPSPTSGSTSTSQPNLFPKWRQLEDGLSIATLTLLEWGISSPTSGSLIGLEIDTTPSHDDYYAQAVPIWICNNFSVLSPVKSLIADTEAAKSLMKKWSKTFKSHGSDSASDYGVPVELGSDAFTLPLLASEVLTSIEIAGVVSLAGFVVLLFVFTLDFGLMLCGTIVMTLILATTFCLHLYFTTNVVDLLDIVVLIAIIGMIVDFPVHMLKYFTMQRSAKMEALEARRERNKNRNQLTLQEESPDSVPFRPEMAIDVTECRFDDDSLLKPRLPSTTTTNSTLIDGDDYYQPPSETGAASGTQLLGSPESNYEMQEGQAAPENNSQKGGHGPAHNMPYALFAPLATSVLVALPLLYATLELLKKTGEYIIIMAVVSYVITCWVFPWLLGLTCTTNLMTRFYRHSGNRWTEWRRNATGFGNEELGPNGAIIVSNSNAQPTDQQPGDDLHTPLVDSAHHLDAIDLREEAEEVAETKSTDDHPPIQYGTAL